MEHLHCMQCNLVYVPEIDRYIHKEQYVQIYRNGITSGLCPSEICRIDFAFYSFGLNETPDRLDILLGELIEELG
ncbi:MAG: hypothetical protein ACE5DM_00540 [Candidatus Nanoarchaeia archaeon]